MRGPPSAKHPCRGVAVSLTLGLVLPLLHLHASVGSFILASKHQWNVTCSYGPVSLKVFFGKLAVCMCSAVGLSQCRHAGA